MLASARPLKQELEARTSRPADSHAFLEVYRRLYFQDWTKYFEASASRAPEDAFAAVRHDAAYRAVNLNQTEPEELFLVSRPATAAGETFRGKHGRLTVIKK